MRFVGDPVAFVVAETLAQAKDAAEAVVLDIEALPAVTEARAAAEPGAPLVFDDAPGNICVDYHYGDSAKVAEAFAKAAHVTRLPLVSNRIVVCAMEPRSAIGHYDAASDRYTLYAGCQGVFGLKHQMADLLKIKPAQMRVLTGNVGGSFGMKGSPYPEYAGLFHASKILGRPVKWTDDRSGSFLSDQHGRDHDFDAELALDKDGNFLAVRLTGFANVGGYLANVGPLMGSMGVTRNLAAIYRTPLIEVATKVVFTNTSPVGAYRGAGRPEANYFMERLIDTAAREMGIDQVELRRRNHIQPEEMPYKTASGTTYDSGEFSILLDKALKLADVEGFAGPQGRERQARQAARPGHRRLSRGHRAADQGDGRPAFRAQRRRHHHHRHARLRPGPLVGLRAGADREARHPVPAHQADPGRQRSPDRRRRHRRLEVDHGERRGHRRSLRQGDRQGQADRGRGARSVGCRHRVQDRPLHHRRHRPRHRHHGTGREAARRHEAARGRARRRSTSAMSTRRRRRPSPTARMSPRSRSIPTPASSRW